MAIKTVFSVFIPEAMTLVSPIRMDIPEKPGYVELRNLIRPLLLGADIEHVSVLYKGRHTDMFVDAEGQQKGLMRNEKATAIYRSNALAHEPHRDPESLPYIYGIAVLCHRRIWF